MSFPRPVRSAAFLEMAGIALICTVLLFGLGVLVVELGAGAYATQISRVFEPFGFLSP